MIQKITALSVGFLLVLLPKLIYAETESEAEANAAYDQSENHCTAAQPRPVVSEQIQKKVKSYSMAWEHSSGFKTGIIEKITLNSGKEVIISSGGCESYGVNYAIVVDGVFKKIPENLTDVAQQYDFLKNWVEKTSTVAKALRELGFKLKGLDNIRSMKKPYTYLEIFSFKDETSINLTDQYRYEVSDLTFTPLKNKKVEITIGHGFIL